jgi:HK97 family phage major capsid protein
MRAEADNYTHAWVKWFRKGRDILNAAEMKALQEGTDSEGGFLVPTDQVKLPYIHDSGVQGGTIRPLASVFQTSRDSGNWPTVGSVLWAPVAEEAALPTTTDPVFGSVAFSIKKIMGMHKVSQELLEDSAVDIGSIISMLYAESLGRYEDQQFIEGDGTTEPEGIRTSGGTDSTGAGTGLWKATGFIAANVVSTFFQLQSNFRANAVWHTTSSTAANIYRIGAAAAGIHFLSEPAVGSPTMMLMGKPVHTFDGTGWDTALSGTNEYGCFGDFRQYYVIDRVGMSIRRLNELYAGNDQVGFVARMRFDGVVALDTAFLIMKGEA